MLSFLYSTALKEAITPGALYDFFSEQMRSDVEVGGTYRQWLETESALSKVPGDSAEAEVLKTCRLLSLGAQGQRS